MRHIIKTRTCRRRRFDFIDSVAVYTIVYSARDTTADAAAIIHSRATLWSYARPAFAFRSLRLGRLPSGKRLQNFQKNNDQSHRLLLTVDKPFKTSSLLGVARFIDASIYRDTFPTIRIAILFFTIAILLFFYYFYFLFFFPQLFSFRQKRYIIISTCDFCKVIPHIHSYFVKIFCEISVETN